MHGPRAPGPTRSPPPARSLAERGTPSPTPPSRTASAPCATSERAIGLDSANSEPWLALGRTYELGGYGGQARDCYRRAILLEPLISATSREAQQVGALRRQFVSVPTQSLEPGRHRLEIRVTDLLTGAVATGATEFARE